MQEYQRLLLNNKAWAMEKLQENEAFFDDLARDQKPKFLWIGCADSRVPAEQITQTQPGEIFVHRNVANLVVHTDMNMLSVLQYAVEVLKVKHIIVCGHYGCGGVRAAMGNQDLGLINKWLRNIKEVYYKHEEEINAIEDEHKRSDRLVELNVLEQVKNLSKTTIVQRAWKTREVPYIHGWVFGLKTGIINEILSLPPNSPIDPVFRYDFD
ncbi:carbonate dehydratase [Siphonobacter aquaeclarae]|jgi:carbonic anhydrase|uniref:Carbonic anhydrase n=1 Tax=Siphonobacter aquaeclarae TaxID=563176 RepID=A0A1G9KFW8_9BACT|nr:carbonate dehydratase [Siphonobacter aquaeclarae]MBO9640346.1 carbonate dehydratase [Siphonobacter aquaeclarae]SDL48512.1 carbonic anhydrase [Siphonobacter aquaeclarae]